MSTTWIGEQIKNAREKRGLTQQELAILVDVATITIHQYEHGKRNPNFDILTKISEVLNTPFFVSRDIRRNIDASIERSIKFDGPEKTAQYVQEKCNIQLLSENQLDTNKPLRAFLNHLEILGYKYIDGSLYDAPLDEVGMLQIEQDNVELPLTQEEFNKLQHSIESNIGLEIYRLRKEKNK